MQIDLKKKQEQTKTLVITDPSGAKLPLAWAIKREELRVTYSCLSLKFIHLWF